VEKGGSRHAGEESRISAGPVSADQEKDVTVSPDRDR